MSPVGCGASLTDFPVSKMASNEQSPVRFDDTDTWTDEMHSPIEQWATGLVGGVDSIVWYAAYNLSLGHAVTDRT